MLAALGLRYGSEEAIDFAVQIQKTLALEAYRASVKMAEQRGAFPIYSAKKEANNPMIGRIREADPALYEEMVQHGRRNIALLTIAPTGTTSLMSQNHLGDRTGIPPLLHASSESQPQRQGCESHLRGRSGRLVEEYNVFHHNS